MILYVEGVQGDMALEAGQVKPKHAGSAQVLRAVRLHVLFPT